VTYGDEERVGVWALAKANGRSEIAALTTTAMQSKKKLFAWSWMLGDDDKEEERKTKRGGRGRRGRGTARASTGALMGVGGTGRAATPVAGRSRGDILRTLW
jgi:hypothetical protein